MAKPEGYFSIGEIARVCGVSIDSLRFYESKALIKPSHIDPESGYRYYSRGDLLVIRAILGLKDVGLSLSEISDYLHGEKHTDEKIAQLRERRELLGQAIENLQIRSTEAGALTVSEIQLPERLCLCRRIEARDGADALLSIGEFYDELIRRGIPISRSWPEFCEYPDYGLLQGEFPVTDFTVTACLPIDKNHANEEAVTYPPGAAVALNYKGNYYGLRDAYKALNKYMKAHGYIPGGYPQEIYVEIGPGGTVNLDDGESVTRVIVPIR